LESDNSPGLFDLSIEIKKSPNFNKRDMKNILWANSLNICPHHPREHITDNAMATLCRIIDGITTVVI
jgi:hypothetical protein